MHSPKTSVLTAVLAVTLCAVSFADRDAAAKSKNITGAFDHCHCVDGAGTCTSITKPTGEDSCFKGNLGTCTGECKFVEQNAGGAKGAATKGMTAPAGQMMKKGN